MTERDLMDIRWAEIRRSNQWDAYVEEGQQRSRELQLRMKPKDDGKPKGVLATIKDGKTTDWRRWTKFFKFEI
ncbi:MAG: hypothetical protein HQL20_11415 [Candidatus Omnitrophica bacterium]|nr:hypothetical protein [Candidatus Omnitrophota bacterium]